MPILDHALDELPVAVVDLETTGFSPKTGARIVEMGVVRVDPGDRPRVVLDTLVNPGGSVHATDVHGITQDDVADAPFFAEMADEFTEAVRGAVVLSYNAAFDLAFLESEMARANARIGPLPFVCLMYLRPLLQAGPRCDLTTACEEVGLFAGAHQATDDAFASALLWLAYRDAALEYGVRTFGDLAKLKPYKFTQSFDRTPLYATLTATRGTAPKPRSNPFSLEAPEAWPPRLTLGLSIQGPTAPFSPPRPLTVRKTSRQSARRIYWHALVDAVDDLHADPQEVAHLVALRERYGLDATETRALHGRLFAERILEATGDELVSTDEVGRLTQLASALDSLGWCPGRPPYAS